MLNIPNACSQVKKHEKVMSIKEYVHGKKRITVQAFGSAEEISHG
jgi:hypothetical protein